MECQELQQIAIELGELDPDEITEVPEGCTYWINWENETVEVDHPYKEVIRDLLEIVRSFRSCGVAPENITNNHIFTQKVLSGEYVI